MPVTPGSGGVRAIFQRSHWSGGTSGGVERIGFFSSCRSCTRPPRQATPRHSSLSGHAMCKDFIWKECKELSQSCVGIDLYRLAQRPTNPLTSRPDWGASPRRGWWAPIAQPYKEEVGAKGSGYEVRRRYSSHHSNPNPILRRGCQRREAPLCRAVTPTGSPLTTTPPILHHADTATTSSLHCTSLP